MSNSTSTVQARPSNVLSTQLVKLSRCQGRGRRPTHLSSDDLWEKMEAEVRAAISLAYPGRRGWRWSIEESTALFDQFERDVAMPILGELEARLDAFCVAVLAERLLKQ